jgi:biotin carboxyl carrier protein
MTRRTITLARTQDDRQYKVELLDDGQPVRARVDQQDLVVVPDGAGIVRIESERNTTAWTVAVGDVRWVFVDGVVYELTEARPSERPRRSSHHGSLTAPMPATVRRVLVKPQDTVRRGESLVILEAMKMELPVRATTDATVRAVLCREGELVQPGVPLVELDELDQGSGGATTP